MRITAQKLEDGRIEFGLQPRAGSGWGERILPRVRFFPTTAAVGRWLSSTEIRLATDSGEFVPVELESEGPEAPYGLSYYARRQTAENAGFDFNIDRLSTKLTLTGGIGNRFNERVHSAELVVFCREAVNENDIQTFHPATLSASVAIMIRNTDGELERLQPIGEGRVIDGTFYPHDPGILFFMSKVDGGVTVSKEWWQDSLSIDYNLLNELRHWAAVEIYLFGWVSDTETEVFSVLFQLEGLFDTPLQGNIDHCGRY